LLYAAFRRYLQAFGHVRPIMCALISANLINSFSIGSSFKGIGRRRRRHALDFRRQRQLHTVRRLLPKPRWFDMPARRERRSLTFVVA
jgi:hypothetical protein